MTMNMHRSIASLIKRDNLYRDTAVRYALSIHSQSGHCSTVNWTSKRGLCKMKDEYGQLDSTGHTFRVPRYELDNGVVLEDVQVRYNHYGELNQAKDNVMVVCHALTGNSQLSTWWSSMLGPGKAFDTSKYFIICANVLGSCYGTTGPLSINPSTGKRYGASFPKVTIRDSVRLHLKLIKEGIGANGIKCVVGGSMGGMQSLEWAFIGEKFVKECVVIGCGAQHNAWQIAISEAQRQAIYIDPKWNHGDINVDDPPVKGLAVARQMAMISYRSAPAYQNKFGRDVSKEGEFEVKSYLEHQGKKFISRFDALTYVRLTEMLDSHDIGRDRGGVLAAMSNLSTRVLIIGMESDVLYPLYEQKELVDHIPKSELKVLKSHDGHDSFLLEQDLVSQYIQEFINGS